VVSAIVAVRYPRPRDPEAEPGRYDHVVAKRLERFADHLFDDQRAVDLRRVSSSCS